MTRYEKTHDAIHRAFLKRGGSAEQWQRVNADPRKFNRAWRRVLDLPDGTHPPPLSMRNIDPLTGEVFHHD